MSDHTDVKNAVFGWARAFDAGDIDAFLANITEDAEVWFDTEGGGTVGPIRGREAIDQFVADRIARRTHRQQHVTTNVVVEIQDDSHATAASYVTIIESSPAGHQIVAVGSYYDKLVQARGTWRISERHLIWTGVAD